MKVEVKKIDAVKWELKFEISKERVSNKLNEVYKEIGKVSKVKGFRPGKTPRHILETQYGQLAQEEMLKKLIPEIYQEGIEKENISPMDLPEILDVSFKDGIVKFTAKLDIKPEVKIKKYKGIKVAQKRPEVTEEEITKTLEYIKKGQGDQKEIILDDAFARGHGFLNLDEFKRSLRRQIESDKDRQNRIDVENQIVDHLLKGASFVVPQSVLKKQFERRWQETQEHFKKQGISEADIKKREEEMRKTLQATVEKEIKVYLMLEKIAELENITVGQKESLPRKVIEFLLKEAIWEEAK